MTEKEIFAESCKLISLCEGLKLKAYYDVSRWSIGYGTISYEGEIITQQEAWKRMQNYVLDDISYLKKIGWDITDPFTIPMLSKGYQYGRGLYKLYLRKSLSEKIAEFNNADDAPFRERREKELKYYYAIVNQRKSESKGIIAFVIMLILASLYNKYYHG